MREMIRELIAAIAPYDSLEREQVEDAAVWIDSGVEIFRIEKPDVPPKHLVSYFVLLDNDKLLLIDHKKAQLWLPPGGHVEKNEHPTDTVKREIQEELSLNADFIVEVPFFITQNKTVNTDAGHTDVSLWYLLRGNSEEVIHYDIGEFNGYRWFSFEEIESMGSSIFHPDLGRFMGKLRDFEVGAGKFE